MTHPAPHAAPGLLAGRRDPLWEGTILGLIVATVTWVWLLVVGAAAGQPFHAFTALGGVATFTLLHYLLNVAFGVAIVWAVHGAEHEASVIVGLLFGSIIVEVAFAMITVLLSNIALGELAWIEIFGGSVLGMAVTIALLARWHPLRARLREAEDAR